MATEVRSTSQILPRCTLCPAICELGLAQTGPDGWRTEYPTDEGRCVCPRGSAMGDLLAHPRRILNPLSRGSASSPSQAAPAGGDGRWRPLSLSEALDRIANRGQAALTILLDGNLPCEELAAAVSWCKAWDKSRLCLVVEPADEMLVLGTEASGADYLPASALADCDGFVIVGNALAANPACARALLDRRRQEHSTPFVVIDPAAGIAAKLATHPVDTRVGGELWSLLAVAAGAGVDIQALGWASARQTQSAAAAGKALAGCKKLAVLLAAEHGRTSLWREIGFLAGTLAKSLGGGVAVQTAGANVLAAVRLAAAVGTVSLAEALADGQAKRVAIGCDVLGMLGWPAGPPGESGQAAIHAAAAALPNRTTELAEIVVPVALPVEVGGTYLADGGRAVQIAAMLAPPAGVCTAARLVEQFARKAGVAACQSPPDSVWSTRAFARIDPSAAVVEDTPSPALLLGRQAAHAGGGELTAYGAWQAAACDEPEVRLPVEDARRLGLADRQPAIVQAGERSVRARVRLAAELPSGRAVLSEGFAQSRALLPAGIDESRGLVVARPVEFGIRPEDHVAK